MSVDKSLKLRNRLARARSVLTRAERIEELSGAGRWEEGDSVFGLPKVRVRRAKRKPKPAAQEVAEAKAAEGAEGAEGAESPTPAEDNKK